MKIAMVCPLNPSGIVGGAERLWEGLVAALVERGHDAELVGLPSHEWTLPDLIRTYATFDALELDDFDMVISGKYPAWMVRHERHVVHMCHTLRGLYDTYPAGWATAATPHSPEATRLLAAVRGSRPAARGARDRVLALAAEMTDALPEGHPDLGFPGPLARELIHFLDADALDPSRVRGHFSISRTVANRQDYFPMTAEVSVVVPPSALANLRCGEFSSIFTASRLDGPKRIELLIDAMAHVAAPCSLRIAGSGPLEAALRARAAHDERIQFLGRITDEQLAEEYANSLVVPFVPLDEDLGLITIEAQMSGKPVVTCSDSGGATDLVRDGVTGFVTQPDSLAIGAALSRLVNQPELAELMGARGRDDAGLITWDHVVDQLLTDRRPANVRRAPRRRIVALGTYPAHPARHGGQVRVNRLYRQLAEHVDVHYIALTADESGRSGAIATGLWQTIVRPSGGNHQIEARLTPGAGVPLGDVVASLAAPFDEDMRTAVEAAAEGADAVILTQPYLLPHLAHIAPDIPVIYDSQNAEWSLKAAMYPTTSHGRALADAVRDVEAAAIRRASLITVVSSEDLAGLLAIAPTLAASAIVPNGADVSTTRFVSGGERLALRTDFLRSLRDSGWRQGFVEVALFIGSGHPPNVAAARAVLRAARDLPDVLFVLVGSHVDALGGSPSGANVMARGAVERDEFEMLLSLCSVALNPMSIGSGTNVKMLDYFAAGAPTVTSEIGARGLGVSDGLEVLFAEPEDLASVVQRVLDDPDAAAVRALAARSAALAFDWVPLGNDFALHVIDLVRTARR